MRSLLTMAYLGVLVGVVAAQPVSITSVSHTSSVSGSTTDSRSFPPTTVSRYNQTDSRINPTALTPSANGNFSNTGGSMFANANGTATQSLSGATSATNFDRIAQTGYVQANTTNNGQLASYRFGNGASTIYTMSFHVDLPVLYTLDASTGYTQSGTSSASSAITLKDAAITYASLTSDSGQNTGNRSQQFSGLLAAGDYTLSANLGSSSTIFSANPGSGAATATSSITFQVTPVPEPSSAALATACAGVMWWWRARAGRLTVQAL